MKQSNETELKRRLEKLNYIQEMSLRENKLPEKLTDEIKYSIIIATIIMKVISQIPNNPVIEYLTKNQIKELTRKWFKASKNFDADFDIVFNEIEPYLATTSQDGKLLGYDTGLGYSDLK